MFITFEGIDGSGKSTQIELLRKKLKAEGYEVEVFREPGGTYLSEKVRDVLLNSDLHIDPVAELLLFSSARAQLMSERVLPLLDEGYVVILDRFYDSTIAYQGYGRASAPIDHIRQVNKLASHQRKPDLTFYLKISLEEAQKRTARARKDRMEQAGDDFFREVIRGFDELAETEDRFVTLNAMLHPEQLHEKIWDKITSAPGEI